MARKRRSNGYTAFKVEGGILPPEFLQTIAVQEAPKQYGVDYGLSKSLVLKEELARYWRIGNDLYTNYSERATRNDLDKHLVGVDEWLVELLGTILGYDDLTPTNPVTFNNRIFNISHRACDESVPLLLVTDEYDLEKSETQFGDEGRRQSPHGLMQEYLNAEDRSLWGIVANGNKLRVLRNNPSLTRPAFLEANLKQIFEEELYSDFAILWLASHASRLKSPDDNPYSCILETWRTEAHETGERALENLREGVTEALRQIGNGFLQHQDNDDLRSVLADGRLSTEWFFQQLLRLVYRLIFLFAAEERNLLHSPESMDKQRDVYRSGYSLARLRDRALRRRHYDSHQDLWQGLRITCRALARGEPVLGLPALGGLFHEGQCPDLDSSTISNEKLLEAIRSLGYFRSEGIFTLINYRDMGTEELGSVYESLLELQPMVDVDSIPWTFTFVGMGNNETTKGNLRKLSGSYYTPPELVNELIKSALEPVLTQAVSEHPDDPVTAILNLNVLDPSCGSGHFLLAAARRMAAEIARLETGTDTFDEETRQSALRKVVQRCIYGVDRNPLAVELCKTALWIETVEPGKPLTFLDYHIQQGDSLVGVLDPTIMSKGIPGDAFKTLTGEDKSVCVNLKKRNKTSVDALQLDLFDEESLFDVAIATADLDSMPEETLNEIERKSAAWLEACQDETLKREELKASLLTGAYFAPKTPTNFTLVPVTEDLTRIRFSQPSRPGIEAGIAELVEKHSFFNWNIAFAEIMQYGGFDVVLGNPPWERIKLQEQEFFASRSPEIANASNKAARSRLIRELISDYAPTADKTLYSNYETAKREAEAASQFVRTAGRFPLTGVGDVNTYALFAETFLQLISPRGRAGLIVPSGIATDKTTKDFFDEVTSKQRLVSLYDFENREKVFSGIDSRIKFCLLTLSGPKRKCPQAEFAFFLHRTEHLRESERRFTLSVEDFALFNPNTRNCPIFRSRRDMEIARKMYKRAGVFWKESRDSEPEVNPWGVKFSTMFHMSNDSGFFRTRRQLEEEGWNLLGNVFVLNGECYVPLYEAKLFHQYDHRFATFDGVSLQDIKNGNPRHIDSDEKENPDFVVVPRYWIHEKELKKRLGDGPNVKNLLQTDRQTDRQTDDNYISIRLITRATDSRTVFVTVLPRCGLGNKGAVIRIADGVWR